MEMPPAEHLQTLAAVKRVGRVVYVRGVDVLSACAELRILSQMVVHTTALTSIHTRA